MSVRAFDSDETRGRLSRMTYGHRDPFEYDYELILGHVIMRRLMYKRQVFTWESVDFFTDSRLSHTLTVAQIAYALATDLELNTYLTVAIALSHDVGHCPYGHLGEIVLNHHLEKIDQPSYDHSLVGPYILFHTVGLDLSIEVLEGITLHGTSSGVFENPVPNEYRVVAISDKVAYTLSDAQDALTLIGGEVYREYTTLDDNEAKKLQREVKGILSSIGQTERERFSRVINAIVSESNDSGEVTFSESDEARHLTDLRSLLHRELYSNTDIPDDIMRLEQVIGKLKNAKMELNPYLLFALLTDKELQYLDKLGPNITAENLAPMQVMEFNMPERDDFSFLVFAKQQLGV